MPRQARSQATQLRLLDATVACLVELGHSRTTTLDVCRHAGVSQGALFKHFPTKNGLLAATVAHLFASLREGFGRTMREIEAHPDRVGAAVEKLWAIFRTPELEAVFDLFAASRTDPELAATLRPVVAAHRAGYVAMAGRLFPAAAARHEEHEALVHTLMMTLQGLAVMQHVRPESDSVERELRLLERLVRAELEPYEDAVAAQREEARA